MNKQSKSLGNRHTNTRTLGTRNATSNTSTASLAVGQNPSVSVGEAPPHPPPIPSYGDKWVRRVYSAVKVAATSGTTDFLQSSFGIPGPYFVDKVHVWSLFSTGNTSVNCLQASFVQGTSTDLGADDVTADDYGTSASLAGVTFKVPLGHAKEVANTGTAVIVKCGAPTGISVPSSAFVVHLAVWVAI
jgi:hypothetical protein